MAESNGEQQPEVTPSMTASQRYSNLDSFRRPFLRRAREAATLTIPAIMPMEGASGSTEFPEPFQSIGADGVNNLASQLLLVLFPPGTSFFRLTVDEAVVQKMQQVASQQGDDGESAEEEMDDTLAQIERRVMRRMSSKSVRTIMFELFIHLLICGNGLVYVDTDGSMKFYGLDKYVVKRDLSGEVLDIIVKETVARETLSPEARLILQSELDAKVKDPANAEKSVDLYTWVQRQEGGTFTVHQEIENKVIPGTDGVYPKGKCPWLSARWRIVPNEDYGRGRCEEYIGDLRSLESLTTSIVMFGAAAAKILFLVHPGSTTDPRNLARKPSGSFVPGNKADVDVLQLEKFHDFQVLESVVNKVEQRLQRAFLMANAVQRDAERVTAEEIRAMIQQLEQQLGGQYSLLAEEVQRPLVTIHLFQMQKNKEIPHLPEKAVSPEIVTGLEGLARSTDVDKLERLVQALTEAAQQPAVAEYLHLGDYGRRMGTALGVDTTGLIRTDQEVEQKQQAAQKQALMEKTAPSLVQAGAKGAQMAQAAQQPDNNSQAQQGASSGTS